MVDDKDMLGPLLTARLTPGGEQEWERFSLPLPEGVLFLNSPLSLVDADGHAAFLQTRALAQWPDRSIRWLEGLAILPRGGAYRMCAWETAPPENAVIVRRGEGVFEIGNGMVSVILTESGSSPLSEISAWGQPMAVPDMPFEASLVMASSGQEFSSAHDDNRRICIRQSGPVRTVAEVTGRHSSSSGESALDYRLQVIVTAGHPAIGLRYRFRHKDPGVERHAIRSLSLRTRWKVADAPCRHLHQLRYGLTSVPRQVLTKQAVDIRAGISPPKIHVHNLDCLDDAHAYPAYMNPPLNDTLPMAGLESEAGWVTVWVEDFKEMCPKGLVADGDEIALQLWPEWAGTLAVSQGRAREIGMQLLFARKSPPDAATVRNQVQALTDHAEITVPSSWFAACRSLSADSLVPFGSDGSVRRFDRYLSRLASLSTVVGMWDLGDTPDPGYGRTYAGIGRLRRLAPDDPPYYLTGTHTMPADWWQPGTFEPVWTNNEYDVILALCREVLRGNPSDDLRQRLRWFARHAVEVDFTCYSDDPSQHHGSPAHSANHNQAGAYPSHLWCEGLLAYYCLSGDEDALDVSVAVGDFILRTFNDPDRRRKFWHFSRELGWALLYLATVADLTGEKRFLDCAEELGQTLVNYPLDEELTQKMATYAFGFSSIAMGIEALWKTTRNPELSAALATWLQRTAHAIANHVEGEIRGESAMVLNFFNASLEVSPSDAHLLRAGMCIVDALVDSKNWTDPPLFAKPVAMVYRGLSRFVKLAEDQGCLHVEHCFTTGDA